MRKIKKQIIVWGSCLLLIFSLIFPYQTLAVNRPEIDSDSALLIDANTGQLLYKQGEKKLQPIAELTKILSVYLIYQLIDEEVLSLDEMVSISDEVYLLSQNYSIPNVPLRQDKEYTIESLLHAVGAGQANSAMLALVEHVDGTEEAFVERMKKQLDAWEIDEYELYNATGMNEDEINQLSPIALALCAYHLIQIAPEFVEYTAKEIDLFDEGSSDEFEMLNPLSHSEEDIYEGIDGLMSGVTQQEDLISVQTAQKDDLRLVSVVLNPTDTNTSNQDHKRLLTYGFAAFRLDSVLNQGDKIKGVANIAVKNGKKPFADLVHNNDVTIVTPLIDTAPVFNYQFVPDLTYFEGRQLVAPIEEGTVIGRLEVQVEDSFSEYLPSLNPPSADIVLDKPIEKGNWLVNFFRNFKEKFNSYWTSVRKFFIRIFN